MRAGCTFNRKFNILTSSAFLKREDGSGLILMYIGSFVLEGKRAVWLLFLISINVILD